MKRNSITKGINANDERFNLFNIMPKTLSKYKKVTTPDFTKASTKVTLDSFLITTDNTSSPNYNPKFEAIQKSLSKGIPNFNRYIKRGYEDDLSQSKKVWPDSYDHEKLSNS